VRAVRNTEGGVRVVDVEPAHVDTNADELVRVDVRASGICGSDLEMVRLLPPGPITLGHEFAGLLDDGRAVAVQPTVPCGSCDRCAAGAPQQCRNVLETMYGSARDGGMADAAVVDRSCLSFLPDGLAVRDASLVEPTAVALHACHRGGIERGMRVAVVGGGTIGLLSAAVARHLGADVAIAARHRAQLAAADALYVSTELGRRYDVVVEAAGSASAFEHATQLARGGGTIVLVATTWEPVEVSFLRAQMRETTIVPAFVYGHAHGEREFDTAARIVADHPELAPALVTHRFPLDDAAHAFDVARDRAHGAIKVVLEP
jgi:2-desacetyl-2-hydroxyethyl bacteriochlorophyllide A dehydrogenase